MKRYITLCFTLWVCLSANAQYLSKDNQQSPQQSNQALSSIEGVTGEMLKLISGPKGQERDWEKFRNLFLPSAQFYALPSPNQNGSTITSWNLEEFIRTLGPIYKAEGFYETPIAYDINTFNGMANVFQSYTAKNAAGTYNAKGINNFILMWDKNRWWIASVTWSNADTNNPIPSDLSKATPQSTPNKPKGKLDNIKKGKIKLN